MSRRTQHLEAVDAEFTRQAATFADSSTLRAADVTDRIAAALQGCGGERVLDVACGPGILTECLTPRSALTIGIDFTAEPLRLALHRAAGNPRAGFVRGLAERAPFPGGCFGGAVIRLALHHFERPGAVLDEVHRVLAPGGRLVVLDVLTSTQPDESRLHNAIERLRDPSHGSFSSESGLREAIDGAEFTIESVETWETPREFSDWAAIVNAPARMASLEVVLQHLAESNQGAGIALRVERGEVWFTYRWALIVARAR
jgi:ubiquinone/menaquinone biosynthesis C-methylase UbiE